MLLGITGVVLAYVIAPVMSEPQNQLNGWEASAMASACRLLDQIPYRRSTQLVACSKSCRRIGRQREPCNPCLQGKSQGSLRSLGDPYKPTRAGRNSTDEESVWCDRSDRLTHQQSRLNYTPSGAFADTLAAFLFRFFMTLPFETQSIPTEDARTGADT
jgi:hypothetical protein